MEKRKYFHILYSLLLQDGFYEKRFNNVLYDENQFQIKLRQSATLHVHNTPSTKLRHILKMICTTLRNKNNSTSNHDGCYLPKQ